MSDTTTTTEPEYLSEVQAAKALGIPRTRLIDLRVAGRLVDGLHNAPAADRYGWIAKTAHHRYDAGKIARIVAGKEPLLKAAS